MFFLKIIMRNKIRHKWDNDYHAEMVIKLLMLIAKAQIIWP